MPAQSSSRNRLLLFLSASDFGLLQPNLEPVMLGCRKVLEKPNRRIDDVYFPEAGFASVVAVKAKETKVEVGLIGREGMTGITIVLSEQAAGEGQRIKAVHLRNAMDASPSLQRLLLKLCKRSCCKPLTRLSQMHGLTLTNVWHAGF